MKRKIIAMVLAAALILGGIPVLAFGASGLGGTSAAGDKNGLEVYGYRDGQYQSLGVYDLGKDIRTIRIQIPRSVEKIKIKKLNCYAAELDKLTLEGKVPAGWAKKLSARDNDIMEVRGEMVFPVSGSGTLELSGRTPLTVDPVSCSIKYPAQQKVDMDSETYTYTLDSHKGNFDNCLGQKVTVPDRSLLFRQVPMAPTSGHPEAPMDIYMANDGAYLYVLAEVYADNTFDHGKDFFAVHIKDQDKLKTYKVHTVENNQYGKYAFAYTGTSPEVGWQHMLYEVKIPLKDLSKGAKDIPLLFEYYGTVSFGTVASKSPTGEGAGINSDLQVDYMALMYASSHRIVAAEECYINVVKYDTDEVVQTISAVDTSKVKILQDTNDPRLFHITVDIAPLEPNTKYYIGYSELGYDGFGARAFNEINTAQQDPYYYGCPSPTKDTESYTEFIWIFTTGDTAVVEEGAVTVNVVMETELLTAMILSDVEVLKDAVLSQESKQALTDGQDVKVTLDVQDINDTVDPAEKSLVEAAVKGSVYQYLDVSLYQQILPDGEVLQTTELANPIAIRLTIPQAMQTAPAGMERTFQMVAVHGGAAQILGDLDGNRDTYTFEADRFSTYALVAVDKAIPAGEPTPAAPGTVTPKPAATAPKTGDSGLAGLALVLLAAGMITAVGVMRKKFD